MAHDRSPNPMFEVPPPTRGGVAGLRPLTLQPLAPGPLVSVLLTNYNYAAYVEAAIRSVLDQTYARLELIVVDDGSTDDSRRLITAMLEHDEQITLLTQSNQGMAAALNAAFAHCHGEVVCLIDADDVYEPDKLQRVVDFFRQHPATGMVQHPLQVIDGKGRDVQVIPFLSRLESGWLGPTVMRRGGRWSCMPTSGLSFRSEVARWLLPINTRRYWISADALLFTVGPLISHVGVIDAPLARYRVHGSNHMSSGNVDRREVRKRIRSYHDTLVGSNQHIGELGLDLPRLQARDHVLYREQLFALSMLRGRRSRVWRRYASLLAALWKDDMYRPAQKLLAVPVYGVLPVLPRRWRGPWLDRVRTYGRLKATAQSLLRLTRPQPAMPVSLTPTEPMERPTRREEALRVPTEPLPFRVEPPAVHRAPLGVEAS